MSIFTKNHIYSTYLRTNSRIKKMNLIFPALFTVCFNPNTELVSHFIIFLEAKISTSLHEENKLNPKLIFS